MSEALQFLRYWAPAIQLTAIEPDTAVIAAKYFASEAGRAEWIKAHNGRHNIYFTVNSLRSPLDKKPKKADISAMAAAHVDIDVPYGVDIEEGKKAAMNKLKAYSLPPSLTIDTGNGIQAFWRFHEPIPVTAENIDQLEGINRALEEDLGGDHCHNIDRIMRLPGTMNLPSPKKRANGRVPVPAVLVEDTELVYSLANFRVSSIPKPKGNGADTSVGAAEDLPYVEALDLIPELAGEIHARLRALIETGDDPSRQPPYRSRSEALFAAVCGLIRAGVGDPVIASKIVDLRWRISTSVRERGAGAHAYAVKQINSARAKLQDGDTPDLSEWDAGDDDDKIPPRSWLFGNLFCLGFLSALIGEGGVGKTALRLLQLLSMAIGHSLTGDYVFRRARVLIVCLEDDRDEIRRRLKAAMIHYGISREQIKDWLYCATPRGVKLAELKEGSPAAGSLEAMVRRAIARRGIDVVSFDPFIKTHSVPENDNTAIDFVSSLLADIATELNVATDVSHHTRKGTAAAGDPEAGRGAGALKDAGRLVFTLTRMTPEESQLFNIGERDRFLCVRLDSAKVNLAPPSAEARWFKLVGVALGNGTPEYPAGDTVQTVEPWSPPDAWEGLSNFLLNKLLTAIDKGLPDGSRYSSAGAARDRAAWRVVVEHAPDKTEGQAREIIKTWIKNDVLRVESYTDPVRHESAKGLTVNTAKRPS